MGTGQMMLMWMAKKLPLVIYVGTAPPPSVRLLLFYATQAPTQVPSISPIFLLIWACFGQTLEVFRTALQHSFVPSFPVFSTPTPSNLPAVLHNKCRSRWPQSTPSATALQLGTFSHHHSMWSHLWRNRQRSVAWLALSFKHSQSSTELRPVCSPSLTEASLTGRGNIS